MNDSDKMGIISTTGASCPLTAGPAVRDQLLNLGAFSSLNEVCGLCMSEQDL